MSRPRWPWAPIVVAGIIMLGATLPGTAVASLPAGRGPARPLLDQAAHVGPFLVFAVVTLRAAAPTRSAGRAVGITVVAVSLLALGSETAQLVVPGRMFDVLDLVLNGLGGLSGLVLASGAGARGP